MQRQSQEVKLYEQVVLLALHDRKGTFTTEYASQLIAGAVLAELLLEGRIALDDSRKRIVDVRSGAVSGDPIIDECLAKMAAAKRRASLKTWVTRLARIKRLPQKCALRLVERGLLRAEERSVLILFTRKVYVEIDAACEREIVERMRRALASDDTSVEPRTAVLIALASGGDLLRHHFDRRELKARKRRIKAITSGDAVGKATKQVIEACQAATMAAVMVPVMVAAGN